MPATITKSLPFHLPSLDAQEAEAVCEVLQSGWITTGPKVKEFEAGFSAYVGARHAVAVNSCTAALHLALEAIGLQEGDEVIVPTLTFAATAETVLYFRATPVLVDSEPETFNLDPDAAESALSPRTKAILPVHFAGQPCRMDRITALAARRRIKVIEDAAHAFPARYQGRMIGTLSDITCFSFYATKNITTGEGGMATTESPEYADRMRMMSLHGISKDAWKRYSREGSWRYEILCPGFKYNLPDILAAIGLVQLSKSDALWTRRQELARHYTAALAATDALETPQVRPEVQHAWHLYIVLIRPGALLIGRDQVIEALKERGIGTSVHFIPLHAHPYYRDRWGYRRGDFPVTEDYFERCISLPLYPAMSDADQDLVVQALLDIVSRYRR